MIKLRDGDFDTVGVGLANMICPMGVVSFADKVVDLSTQEVIKWREPKSPSYVSINVIRQFMKNTVHVDLHELVQIIEDMYSVQIKMPFHEHMFDPEFDSGCSTCDTEFPMSEMHYDSDTGDHTCQRCFIRNTMKNIREHNEQ
jgi:hypothetical protein